MNHNGPVHIRRNVEDFDDPYTETSQLPDNTVCRECGDVYAAGRWYARGHAMARKNDRTPQHEVVCPGCRKQRDKLPGGILRISGAFFGSHQDEIMNLIRNETDKAHSANPLERVMSIEEIDGEIEVATTNEKLAQRIGKALHKASSGNIEYKWSDDTKLARVNWYRD